jgi:hypothetical protein
MCRNFAAYHPQTHDACCRCLFEVASSRSEIQTAKCALINTEQFSIFHRPI